MDKCPKCGKGLSADKVEYCCPHCGEFLMEFSSNQDILDYHQNIEQNNEKNKIIQDNKDTIKSKIGEWFMFWIKWVGIGLLIVLVSEFIGIFFPILAYIALGLWVAFIVAGPFGPLVILIWEKKKLKEALKKLETGADNS